MSARLLLLVLSLPTGLRPQQPERLTRLLQEGGRLFEQRRLDLAEERLREALGLALAAPDLAAEAEARRGLGRIHNARALYQEARAELEAAAAISGKLANRSLHARVLNEIAYTEWATGNQPRAQALYGEALAAIEGTDDKQEIANLLYNLAFVSIDAGKRGAMLERALAAAREAGDIRLQGKVWHTWGDFAYVLGDFRTALERLRTASRLLQEAKFPAGESRVLISLGRLYHTHGRYEAAAGFLARAADICRATGDRQGLVYCLQNTGSTRASQGRVEEAVASYQEAMALARETGSKSLLATALAAYGSGLNTLGRRQEAKRALEESVALRGSAAAEDRLARTLLELGELSAAEAAASTAIESARGRPLPEQYLTYATRALARERQRRPEEALADMRASLAAYETLRGRLAPADFLKRGYHERAAGFAAEAIGFYYRAGRHEDSFEVAEQARARAFLDLLAGKELERISEEVPAPGEVADLDLKSPGLAPSLSAADARELAARENTTVVSFWTTARETYVWVVRGRGGVSCARTGIGRDRIRELVRQTQSFSLGTARGAAVTRPRTKAAGADPWRELHRALIEPVAGALPPGAGSRLTIVPHGPLFGLSFAALKTARKRYLAEDYTLAYAPSAALVREVSPSADPRPAEGFLLIADPAHPPAGADGKALPALPGARQEAAAIARALGAGTYSLLAGADAAEKPVRSSLGGKRVLHFATHGVLLDQKPLDSYLALGAGSPSLAEDGRLTAREIYSLHLNADMVVLSACRSGLGAITGDGVNGLTRAFFYAGARSVVATLWDVPDTPTNRLVSSFYAHYLRHGRKSEALRAAQMETLAALRRGQVTVRTALGPVALPEHPSLWAGFVVIGQP